MKNGHYVEVNLVGRESLLWLVSLLRIIWLPFLISIAANWLGAFLNIGVSTLLAYAFSQGGGMNQHQAILPQALATWFPEGAEYIPRTLYAAVSLILVFTLTACIRSLAGAWIHVRLTRYLTPAAISSVMARRPGRGGLLDAATAVQRWLLKSHVVDFFFNALGGIIGSMGGITMAVFAVFRVSHQGGLVCAATVAVCSFAAVHLGLRVILASRNMARSHEDVGRRIRAAAALRHDLSTPSWQRYWAASSEADVSRLGKTILLQGVWGTALMGVLSFIAGASPAVAVLVTIPFGGVAAGIAVLLYASQLGPELSGLARLLPSVPDYLISVQRVFDAYAHLQKPGAPAGPPLSPSHISINNLAVSLDSSVHVLQFPDCDVRAGELLAVLGPSGSGKSTFLLSLLGFETRLSGTVSVNDEVMDPTEEAWLDACSFLPQEPQLLPGSLDENLRQFPFWKPFASLTVAVDALLRKTADGGNTMTNTDVPGISVGQRRIVSLLRCLGGEPTILLLDEPLAGIDDDMTALLRLAIIDALKQSKIIIATMHAHDFERLGIETARVVRLDGGTGR
jgi:ABC-type multidrug transport system fused ATPase/permease subunit